MVTAPFISTPNDDEATATLARKLLDLRLQALNAGVQTLGTHQLYAHWSLAYACGQAPEPWEIYRCPTLHLMPTTDFYDRYPDEIQEALRTACTWELLRKHAEPKLALDATMTVDECKAHAYPGDATYYDAAERRWLTLEGVPRVRWFDDRDRTREALMETAEDWKLRTVETLEKHRAKANAKPTAANVGVADRYEAFYRDELPKRMKTFSTKRNQAKKWLAKLDATPDFGKALFALVREAENAVRAARGIAAVGEAWVSETELLYRVRQLLPGVEVLAHGQPTWLGRQHLDIWVPSLKLAVEYHGAQHFRPVEFFGGQEAFERGQERDSRKRALCIKHGVRLVEVSYDQNVDDRMLKAMLGD